MRDKRKLTSDCTKTIGTVNDRHLPYKRHLRIFSLAPILLLATSFCLWQYTGLCELFTSLVRVRLAE